MIMNSSSEHVTILANFIRELARTSHPELQEKVLEADLRASNENLHELNCLLNEKPKENYVSPLARIALKEALRSRLKTIHQLVLTKNEQRQQSGDNVINRQMQLEDRLCLFGDRISRSLQVQESLDAKAIELHSRLNEFLNSMEHLLVNYGLKFKLEHDKKSIEAMITKAQFVLVQKRFSETEQAATKYGDRELVNSLKKRRQELEAEGKRLKNELLELQEQKRKLNELDPKLQKEVRDLMSELECKKWAVSNLKSD